MSLKNSSALTVFSEAATAGAAPTNQLRIKRRPLHEEVVDRLRDLIVEGGLTANERLHETVLANMLGVSRTPVREALKLLASEGMIELLANRGARIVEVSATEIAELFEVLGGIERLAAELAAERMSDIELERLKALHERLSQHFLARNRRDYAKINIDLHRLIVTYSGNQTLNDMHRRLMTRVRRVRFGLLEHEKRWSASLEEHAALLRALLERDGREAGAIMHAHVRETGRAALAMFSKASEGDPARGGPKAAKPKGLRVRRARS